MLKIDARIKSSIKQLPVMVTSVKVVRNGNRYSICTKHGHLKGTYDRNDLVPRKGHTSEMQGINEKYPGFRRQMIIQDACNAYSKMEHYNCKGNCETLARCAFRAAGRICTSLCHGGKGNNKLCGMYDDLDEASNEEDEESTKVHVNTPIAEV